MAGHSKWANIRHRKGAQDAVRSKVFAKLSKEIMVAAASGGGDPSMNASLRMILAKARAKSMPKKNIQAAIDKATGAGSADNFKEIVYGGNVNGVSFLVVYLTDNSNRVAANVQSMFKRSNGSVGAPSSVSYVFDRKGVLAVLAEGRDEDEFMMMALEAGADDFEVSGDTFFIYTDPSSFSQVKDNLEKEGIKDFKQAEVSYIPNTEAKLTKEKAERLLDFIDRLEDDDDVQDVYHNLDADSLN
ncbi:MAG: YebC/PmpR family DNA-binding transcriptional regulator [Mycoplasmataceae bacterium]|nr:YebC/PmpR family DNA-binding transcriptional regulator [Mycoplasmataceae bacterium]